jgi:predicted RNase H-like nuclease (RuvC/YqgF family)
MHAENRSRNAGLPPEQIEEIKIMFIEGKAISSAIQSVVEMNLIPEENNQSSDESISKTCNTNSREESSNTSSIR